MVMASAILFIVVSLRRGLRRVPGVKTKAGVIIGSGLPDRISRLTRLTCQSSISLMKRKHLLLRPDQRRQQLLDAATWVFARKGFRNASITDIIQRAGVAR